MITKRDVHIFVENEPLLEAVSCHAALDAFDASILKGKSLFFGIGLCTDKEPAVAIPFDVLSFILTAERLKQFFSLSEVIILIADTHARTNTFMSNDLVVSMTKNAQQLFIDIIGALRLTDFHVMTHSHIASDPSFQETLQSLPPMDNQYLRHELADILWLTQHHNLGIKLGWTIDSSLMPSGHDERFFDAKLKKLVAIPVAFLHTKSGRTFDKHRQKVSPYIVVQGETRVILDPNENVQEKFTVAAKAWDDPHFGGTTKHIATIVRAFEKQFGSIPSSTLIQKTQHIIDGIFRKESL